MVEADGAVSVFGPSGILCRIVECAHAHTFIENAARVDIGDAQFRLQFEADAFDHQITQLIDHALTIP